MRESEIPHDGSYYNGEIGFHVNAIPEINVPEHEEYANPLNEQEFMDCYNNQNVSHMIQNWRNSEKTITLSTSYYIRYSGMTGTFDTIVSLYVGANLAGIKY